MRTPEGNGYYKVRIGGAQVREHVAVAERAIGRRLPAGACVHHIDGDRSNNDPRNLVVCPSNGYHRLLHQRLRALAACGHAGWLKCQFCKHYGEPRELIGNTTAGMHYHRRCYNAYQRESRARRLHHG